MRKSGVVILALWLTGCANVRPGPGLTVEQATTLAVRLANDKAAGLYQCQPFQAGPAARFAAGRWVWTDRCGAGHEDLQVAVELAADGSTNRVDLKLLDGMNRMMNLMR